MNGLERVSKARRIKDEGWVMDKGDTTTAAAFDSFICRPISQSFISFVSRPHD